MCPAPFARSRQLVSLLKWQWDGYARYYCSRTNLLGHIVLVPMFLAGNVVLVSALLHGSIFVGSAGAAITVVSVALQGLGHRKEPVSPEPFTSKGNALARVFLEQWVTFPRFVMSGRWWRALMTAGKHL